MAITLSSRPSITGSTWVAAKNPVVYTFLSSAYAGLENYRIEVEVFSAVDDSSLSDAVTFVFKPDGDGLTIADISSIIKSYLSAEWEEPSGENDPEPTTSISFYIKYQELYDGSATSVVDDVANPINGVFAAMQIFYGGIVYPYGANMLSFTPTDSTTLWMTRFAISTTQYKVRLWRDYPWTISFIWPASVAGINRITNEYDRSGALLTSTTTALDNTGGRVGAVNRLNLPTLHADTTQVRMYLQSTTGPTTITSTLIIDVEEACANPVYLFWKNSAGGDSFYLFQYSQDVNYILNDKKAKRMILFADNIDYVEWEALNELNSVNDTYSPNIQELTTSNRYTSKIDGQQVYLISGSSKIGVTVIPTSTPINTRDTKHSIQITIELPRVFE